MNTDDRPVALAVVLMLHLKCVVVCLTQVCCLVDTSMLSVVQQKCTAAYYSLLCTHARVLSFVGGLEMSVQRHVFWKQGRTQSM